MAYKRKHKAKNHKRKHAKKSTKTRKNNQTAEGVILWLEDLFGVQPKKTAKKKALRGSKKSSKKAKARKATFHAKYAKKSASTKKKYAALKRKIKKYAK